MRQGISASLRWTIDAVLVLTALVVCLNFPTYADKRTEARDQFERAVKLRTMLEGYLPRDRALDDYKQTIAAYQKVYLISTQAEDVTPSLIAEGELYREMGRLFDPKYFQTAINMYQFLLKQYPESRYRGEATFAIAEIQKEDQKNFEAATATFRDFLKRYPKNARVEDAREALAEMVRATDQPQTAPGPVAPKNGAARPAGIAGAANAAVATIARKDEVPDLGPAIEPREPSKAWASVKSVDATNGAERTRIVVALDDTVEFEEAHLRSPDRIYFDLHKARVGGKISGKDFQSGLLKSVRVGQNKPDVVRVVLDANGAKNCAAILVGKPYRLVIDLRRDAAPSPSTASNNPASVTPASGAAIDRPKAAETVTVDTGKSTAAADSPTMPAAAVPAAKIEKTAGTSGTKTAAIKPATGTTGPLRPPREAQPTRDGQRSLTRTLGLKIGRIVIDPGHGGHDTGTIGPRGLMEKDLCLDVALRLGHIIEEKLPGAEVVYTRKDDTFIPLEQRTAIANEAKADLFISIHANSSRDHDARGVETYYLNFATSGESMEVATRENAYSEKSLHDLQDLVQKIARNEKIEESKELASDIQDALSHRLQLVSSNERNRGVKRAPFIVLIGANMPSVLSEISFVSNPTDERLLKKTDQRERIANGLYRGIAAYLESLNSLSYNKQKFASDGRPGAAESSAPSTGPSPRPER